MILIFVYAIDLSPPCLLYVVLNYHFLLQITHITIDEVHCVLSWGQSKFRPAYLLIPSLRAIIPGAKLLALTATATPQAQRAIMKELLMDHAETVTHSPDR